MVQLGGFSGLSFLSYLLNPPKIAENKEETTTKSKNIWIHAVKKSSEFRKKLNTLVLSLETFSANDKKKVSGITLTNNEVKERVPRNYSIFLLRYCFTIYKK